MKNRDLYTSLLHLKREMNDGVLPQMTSLTARARKYLDPEFTIGMGALIEDAEKGLRCPVRGCGGWFHCLTRHADMVHRGIGGAEGLKRLLDIPPLAKLSSTVLRKLRSDSAKRCYSRLHSPLHRGFLRSRHGRKKTGRSLSTRRRSTGYRNFVDLCEAQVAHRLVDLAHKIGRSPSMTDIERELGVPFRSKMMCVFGSLNAAKASVNLRIRKPGRHHDWENEDDIVTAFQEYYRVNGCLPTYNQLHMPTRTPLIPGREIVRRVMKTNSHPEAMRRIATLLGIEDGRYGTKRSAR